MDPACEGRGTGDGPHEEVVSLAARGEPQSSAADPDTIGPSRILCEEGWRR
jgi:hypothetical protein